MGSKYDTRALVLGLCPRPSAGGAYNAPPDPLVGWGRGKGGQKGKRREKKGEG